MNAYQRAQQLGLTGTDAEIVAALKPTTAAAIDLAYLMEMLNFRGMLRKTDGSGGQERWQGTLQNLKSALSSMGLTAAVESYETWFSHVTNPRQVSWDTSIPAYAKAFGEMEAAFAGGQSMPTVEDFNAVAALGGGHPYADLTVEQYAQQRVDAIAAEAAAVSAAAAAQRQNAVNGAISQATAAVQQQANESEASLSELIATFTASLTQHWSV